MRRRQQVTLGICAFVVYADIAGLVGLMPVRLTDLGADPTAVGFILAAAYLALALSNVVAGRLSDLLQRRTPLLVAGGLAMAPLAWLLSHAETVWSVGLLMAGLWFALGFPMAIANILTGLSADAAARGRSFGVLTFAGGVGLFTGSAISGPIVDRGGFPALFAAFAALSLIVPVVGCAVPDRQQHRRRDDVTPGVAGAFGNRVFAVLFVATVLAQAANIVIFLSRPLIMDARGFDATAISTAAAIGSLATLPLPLLVGWLADRIGRTPVVAACLLAPSLGLVVQAGAGQGWHFWVSSLLSSVVGVGVVAGSALVTDLVPAPALGIALAWLGSTAWIGIVIGLSAGGLAIRAASTTPALVGAALVGLSGFVLLLAGWGIGRRPKAAP